MTERKPCEQLDLDKQYRYRSSSTDDAWFLIFFGLNCFMYSPAAPHIHMKISPKWVNIPSLKANCWMPKMMGLGKGNSLSKWQFLGIHIRFLGRIPYSKKIYIYIWYVWVVNTTIIFSTKKNADKQPQTTISPTLWQNQDAVQQHGDLPRNIILATCNW